MLGQPRDGDGQPASGADPLDRLPGPVRSRAAEEQAFGSLRVGQPLELTGQPGPGLRSPIDLEPGREGHSGAAEPDAGVGAEAVGHFPASTEGGLALPVHLPALSPGGAQEGASEVDDGQAVREYAVLQATDGRPAHQGAAGGAAYGATKAALSSMTRAWAAEFSPSGVRVNAIAPGPVYTRPEARELFDTLGATTLLNRAANPEEIAEVVGFLASSRASYVTGAIIAADGGRTAI